MPRYFFHVHDAHQIEDNQGVELPDDAAAWREATLFAGALFKDFDGRFRPGQSWRLEVTLESGSSLFEIGITSKQET